MSIASLETPVYSILLKLQDIICKSPLLSPRHHKTLQEQQQQASYLPRHSDSPRDTLSPDQQKSKNSTLTCLLQSEQKQSRSTLALSQRKEINEFDPSTEHRISSSTSSSISLKQQQLMSQEVSELEEDEVEDGEQRKAMQCHTMKQWRKKGLKYNIHHKQETRRYINSFG